MRPYVFLSEQQSRRLKSIIVNAGVDIGTIATKMGISRPTLSNRINGKTDFTRKEMEHFAEILNENPQKIFFTL